MRKYNELNSAYAQKARDFADQQLKSDERVLKKC